MQESSFLSPYLNYIFLYLPTECKAKFNEAHFALIGLSAHDNYNNNNRK